MGKVISIETKRPAPQPECLRIGQTFENASIRVHRWSSAVQVWDLANAGKRGKKVANFSLYNTDYIKDPIVDSNFNRFLFGIFPLNYAQAKYWAEFIARDAKQRKDMGGPAFEEREARGVDVVPAGCTEIVINNEHCEATIEFTGFCICDKHDQNNLPASRSDGNTKKQLKDFYLWVKANQETLQALTFREWDKLIEEKGLQYRCWCRMD